MSKVYFLLMATDSFLFLQLMPWPLDCFVQANTGKSIVVVVKWCDFIRRILYKFLDSNKKTWRKNIPLWINPLYLLSSDISKYLFYALLNFRLGPLKSASDVGYLRTIDSFLCSLLGWAFKQKECLDMIHKLSFKKWISTIYSSLKINHRTISLK